MANPSETYNILRVKRGNLSGVHTVGTELNLIPNVFDIPLKMMPEVSNNVDEYGHTSLFGGKIKIGGMAGDQQSALIGQCCFNTERLSVLLEQGHF